MDYFPLVSASGAREHQKPVVFCSRVVLLLALPAACDSSTVTNNYYLNPAPSAVDAGDAGKSDGLPTDRATASSAPSSISSATDLHDEAGVSTEPESPTLDGGASDAEPGTSDEPTWWDAGQSSDASVGPIVEGAPAVNTAPDDLNLDVFGTNQNRYWFIASQPQIDAINQEFYGGYGYGGDIYAPGGNKDERTIDHLLVSTPEGQTADFGEMQVKLVGQSTGRPWTDKTLPNFKIDSDDVTPGLRLGGYEHLRFNNAIVGSIYREKFIYDYYHTLGYPAPRATYGWVSTTAWAPDVAVPYIVVESYKRGFCRERPEYFGGECPNMWEFASDMGWGVFGAPENCQFESCDSTRADEMEEVVVQARVGLATIEDVGEYVDWQRFHEFQCLSWIFGTSDDAIHGGNNTVWVERPDGKFQLLPYSIDISLWGGDPGLAGYTSVADICQRDAACWQDTVDTCVGLVDAFVAADPVARIDALHEELDEAGMLRAGDEQRHDELRRVLGDLATSLPQRIEQYRDNPWGSCQYPMVECGGSCVYPADCYLCQDWYYEQGSGETVDYGSSGQWSGQWVETSGVGITTAPPPMGTAMAADIALPVPVPVPPPPPPPPPPVDADGGVDTSTDGGGGKPDFCYWKDGYPGRPGVYFIE